MNIFLSGILIGKASATIVLKQSNKLALTKRNQVSQYAAGPLYVFVSRFIVSATGKKISLLFCHIFLLFKKCRMSLYCQKSAFANGKPILTMKKCKKREKHVVFIPAAYEDWDS